MKKRILRLCQWVVGMLFMFSGFVKCIDPTGGAIKIEDYFIAWGLDGIPFSIDLTLSIMQNILEFLVGFMLITNVFVPFASTVALAFMCFYTPLTLYIALANPVSDCGCFGDAVKLSNWETFGKNLVFLPLTILVFIYRQELRGILSTWRKLAIAGIGFVVALIISVKGITDEPMIDYRPYSVGTDINKAMSIPEDAPMPEYKTTFILEKDGKQEEFDENNYPYNDTTWHYIDANTIVISEGYVPPIKDFTLVNNDGETMTDHILHSDNPIVMVIAPNLDDISDNHARKIAEVASEQLNIGNELYIVTSSNDASQEQFNNRAESGFDYLQGDETMLKTIMRSNGGIFIVQNGIVISKYHINHLPAQGLSNPVATKLSNIEGENARLIILSTIFAVVILLVLLGKKKHKSNILKHIITKQ